MKKKILVLDDDSLACQLIVAALEAEGYEVMASTNFQAALQSARQIRPDLVMIDVVMPDVTGFEACNKIKEIFQPHPPPVIVMTGKLNAVDPARARRMGADDFVVKTSDMAVLVQAAQKIFSEKTPHDLKFFQ